MADRRDLHVTEDATIPWLSIVFGFLPMLPFAAGAVAAWAVDGVLRAVIVRLTILWAAVILTFLGGVRRGLSFRTPGGPRGVQMLTMLALFGLGFLAAVAVELDRRVPGFALALGLELAGFLALAVLDPIAARHEEAPLFFARLRPIQMPIALVSLAALLILVLST